MNNRLKMSFGVFLWLILLAFVIYIPLMPLITDKSINASFLDSAKSDKALIFFGFPSCGDVCPLTLATFANALKAEDNQRLWPDIIFVNIDATSSMEETSAYAKLFHPHFTGHFPESKELDALAMEFGLNVKQFAEQILHLGKTYLVERQGDQWRLVKAYNPETFSVDALQNDLFKPKAGVKND